MAGWIVLPPVKLSVRMERMNRTVFISGASAGIGAAIAHHFAADGDRVIVNGRRRERLQRLVEEIGADKVLPLPFDMRDGAAMASAINGLGESWGHIDILINNAGLALGLEKAWETNVDDWDTMVDTNIRGLLHLTRLILPGMVARKRGHIVNIGSTTANWPYPGGHVYGASKAFVQQFSRNLRADLHGQNIRVSILEPGIVATEFSEVRFRGDKERAKEVYANAEALQADDMAAMVLWMCSLPTRINVNQLEVMPSSQSWGPLRVAREE
jgi:3-hydroxy acid dehydrogenase/malonic semialdehyde reductase